MRKWDVAGRGHDRKGRPSGARALSGTAGNQATNCGGAWAGTLRRKTDSQRERGSGGPCARDKRAMTAVSASQGRAMTAAGHAAVQIRGVASGAATIAGIGAARDAQHSAVPAGEGLLFGGDGAQQEWAAGAAGFMPPRKQ